MWVIKVNSPIFFLMIFPTVAQLNKCTKHTSAEWDFIQLNVQYAAKQTILVWQCCPRLCFTVDRWKETLPQHVQLPFIKQHTKAVLTVSYFLRKRKLSKKAELMEFKHPSYKGSAVMLISVDVLHVFLSICNICVYFEQKVTDKSEQVQHLFFPCTTNWSCVVPLQKADVWCTWNRAEQKRNDCFINYLCAKSRQCMLSLTDTFPPMLYQTMITIYSRCLFKT